MSRIRRIMGASSRIFAVYTQKLRRWKTLISFMLESQAKIVSVKEFE